MNRLHQRGVAGEGLSRRDIIGLEHVADVLGLRRQRGTWEPRQAVFEVAPHARDRVQLGTVGQQPDRAAIRRPDARWGRVSPAVIQEQDVQALGVRLGKGVAEELAPLGLEVGACETEARASGRRHRPRDLAPREDVLDRSEGLDAAGGAAAHGQQAQTTFVLTAHAHCGGRRWREDAPTLRQTACLKCADGVGVFGCDWAVPP